MTNKKSLYLPLRPDKDKKTGRPIPIPTAKVLLNSIIEEKGWYKRGGGISKQSAYGIRANLRAGTITIDRVESTLIQLGAKKTKEAQWAF